MRAHSAMCSSGPCLERTRAASRHGSLHLAERVHGSPVIERLLGARLYELVAQVIHVLLVHAGALGLHPLPRSAVVHEWCTECDDGLGHPFWYGLGHPFWYGLGHPFWNGLGTSYTWTTVPRYLPRQLRTHTSTSQRSPLISRVLMTYSSLTRALMTRAHF